MYKRRSVSVAAVAAVSWLLFVQSVFAATSIDSGDQAIQSIYDSYQSKAIAPCTYDGKVEHWNYGQANPPDGNDFVAIAVGFVHSLALKSDGTIVGWGAGSEN